MDSAANDEIALDFRPFFITYKDGLVERLSENDFVPPSLNPEGVSSKDVTIVPELGVSARLFLPKLNPGNGIRKLPILVYYHGGGFCFVSAFCGLVHHYLTSIVMEANVIAVSVEFRRFPEHTLPAAYEDSWAALQWVASHFAGGTEPWLSEHGDVNRITIMGDSAGANIVHNMAMRAGQEELVHGVKIDGAILGHPYFCGVEAVGDEVKYPEKKAEGDYIWMLTNPTTIGLDDPQINPMAVSGPSLSGLGCTRVLLFVAGKDILRDRGRLYYERLRLSGWKGTVEMVESEGEEHVFHLYKTTSENARIVMQHIVSFLN